MDAKDDIKRRLSVEDVVGSYIELKRAGRNFKGLSPFGNEKTPSFMVSPDKQIWHDFSANKGGDIFTFVMEMEGVDFKGAIEILARKAGVDLSQYQGISSANTELKNRLYQILELATKYYHATLAKNSRALNYLRRDREYESATISVFQLGYAPNEGTALLKFLQKKQFKIEEIKKSGLIVERRGMSGDMFRGRIMIPLKDNIGRVIGFTARLLDEQPNAPKYINTPKTLLYDKSRHVFGLDLAKEQIRQKDFTVVVEGNLDVIASHQAGAKNCVAIAGTALTRDHLVQIGRLSNNVGLALDQDKAGVAATERAIPIAQDAEVNLSIIDIPEGKDPDELIKRDKKIWLNAIANSVYVMDWLIEHFSDNYDLTTAQGKKGFSDKLIEVIVRIKDPVEIDHYASVISKKTGVSLERIRQKIAEAIIKINEKQTRKSRDKTNLERHYSISPTFNYVDTFIGLLVRYPETREALRKLSDLNLDKPYQQAVLNEIIQNPDIKEKDLLSDENYVKIITFRAEDYYGTSSSSARVADAMETARRVANEIKKNKTAILAQQLREAKDSADDKTHDILLRQVYDALKKED